MLAYFTASWCGACKLMARTTLANQKVLQSLSSIEHVAIDIDEKPDLAESYGVEAIPTFVMLSPGGRELTRATGYQSDEEFLQWLADGVHKVKAGAARYAQLDANLKDIDQLIASGDRNSERNAATQLFDLCSDQDVAINDAAMARLKPLADRSPVLLLDGLRHPRLATRIQIANLLRERIGDTFDFDPWNSAQARELAIATWRKKLRPSVQNAAQ